MLTLTTTKLSLVERKLNAIGVIQRNGKKKTLVFAVMIEKFSFLKSKNFVTVFIDFFSSTIILF